MKSIAQIFLSRRMAIVLFLGFSAGLPIALTKGTLQAWLSMEKIDVQTIGLFTMVGAPYTYKFVWSPFMDRYRLPFLGRRRGWMIATQVALIALIAGMAVINPGTQAGLLAVFAVAIAFSSASQDIVIDAYRTELLDKEEYGAGSGYYVMGYRLAMLVSGGLALILAERMTFPQIYLTMAGVMTIGLVTTLFAPNPVNERPVRSLPRAIVLPLRDYFLRPADCAT